MITSRLRRPAMLCALAAMSACSEDDSPTSPFASTDPVEPTGVYISAFEPSAGPTIEWVHDDDDESGFVVEWWTGGADVATVVGELAPDVRRFTHDGYDAGAVNNYRVRAEYDGNLTGFEDILRVDPRLDAPENADLNLLPGDSIAVTWNPADFTPFDGFRVRRLIGSDDELELESDRIVIVESSLEVTWVDVPPVGTAFDERLRYLVETRTLEIFSPPTPAGELAWQYPTRPLAVVLGGPLDTDVAARHGSALDRTIITYTRDAGSVLEMSDFDAVTGLQSMVYVTVDDGELRGAPLTQASALVAHRSTSGDVTLCGYDGVFGPADWSVPRVASRVPAVGPAGVGSAYVAYDDTIERVDGADGSVLETIALDPLIAGGEVLDLDTDRRASSFVLRTTEDGSSAPGLALQRLDLTASGAVAFTRTLTVGHVPATLTVSPSRDWVALNYDENEDGVWRSLLYDASTGAPQAAVLPGRVVTFGDGDEHAIILDDEGRPTAVRLDGSLAVEDQFGEAGSRGGYVESDGAFIAFQTAGRVYRYALERGWATPLDGDPEPRRIETDVPVTTWKRSGIAHAN